MGASFVLLTLAMAIPTVISGKVLVNKLLSNKDILLSAFVVSLPAVVAFDGKLTRLDGMILFIAYITYVCVLNKEDSFVKSIKSAMKRDKSDLGKVLLMLVVGTLGIFFSSRFIVILSLNLANVLLIPSVIVGILFLSIGTNLPELTLALKSLTLKHKNIGIGDFLGSATVNTFVLSLLCFFKPFQVNNLKSIRLTSLFLILGVIVLSAFLKTRKRLSRKEGFVLIFLYLLFLFSEVLGIKFL